jgi:DNA helicase HerA-like ATPase
MPESAFYLGRLFDLNTSRLTSQPFFYDPADLTTHAIVTGMTGSGKTGLCIALLEEAALQGIPALIVDPKGDLTNLLLHFPNLSPRIFSPGSIHCWRVALEKHPKRPLRRPPASGARGFQNGIFPPNACAPWPSRLNSPSTPLVPTPACRLA